MPESMSYAIATQQSHATGNTPKDYGTAEGKREAKRKYDEPGKMKQTADPRHKAKSAAVDLAFWSGFSDELSKIAAAMPKLPPMPKPRAISVPREPHAPESTLDLLRHSHTNPPPLSTTAG